MTTTPPTSCIPADDPHPAFPTLPGARECNDTELCLPEPDWRALIDYFIAAEAWMSHYEHLCKESGE